MSLQLLDRDIDDEDDWMLKTTYAGDPALVVFPNYLDYDEMCCAMERHGLFPGWPKFDRAPVPLVIDGYAMLATGR